MPYTGTSVRRKDNAQLTTSLMLAGAAGLTLFGLRQALRSEPDFTGQVVLITGGSRGLGLSMAEEFRRRGAHLVLRQDLGIGTNPLLQV